MTIIENSKFAVVQGSDTYEITIMSYDNKKTGAIKHVSNADCRFLVKHYADGKIRNANEETFYDVIKCKRVLLYKDMYEGRVEHNPEELIALKGNQPLFDFCRRRNEDGEYEWMGRFLFSVKNVEFARRVIDMHARELGIVLAFAEEDFERYWFVVQVSAGDYFSDDTEDEIRNRVLKKLHKYFPRVNKYGSHFFVRAEPLEAYDLIDHEKLFGDDPYADFEPVDSNTPPAAPAAEAIDNRSCKVMSLGEIINTIFGGVFAGNPVFNKG